MELPGHDSPADAAAHTLVPEPDGGPSTSDPVSPATVAPQDVVPKHVALPAVPTAAADVAEPKVPAPTPIAEPKLSAPTPRTLKAAASDPATPKVSRKRALSAEAPKAAPAPKRRSGKMGSGVGHAQLRKFTRSSPHPIF